MIAKTSVLEAYAFYRSASPQLREAIETAARPVNLRPGTYSVGPEARIDGVLLLGSGRVRVFMDSETGREVTLCRVGRGELCPLNLVTLMSRQQPAAKAVVEAAVLGVTVPVAQFESWVESDTLVRRCTFDAMATSLIQVTEQIQQITFGRLDRRLADYLLCRCPEPGGEVRLTHEQIAADLSTAREVVSRLLRDFERRGAVSLGRGKVILRSADVLSSCVSRPLEVRVH